MLNFIPFIPFGTQGVDETIWNTALLSWKRNLTQLLNIKDDQVFLNEVMSNSSLASFIDQVWNEQLNNTSAEAVDTNLIRYIFLLYNRLALLAESTSDSPLLTIEKICSFVLVYGESNSIQVRRIMTSLVNESNSLGQNLLSTMGMLIDSVRSMPSSLGKNITVELLDRAYVLVRVLDALLSSTVHLDVIGSSFDTLDQVLIDCYRDLIPCLKQAVDNDASLASYAYLIKQSLVSSFNTYVDIRFLAPLGNISSTTDHHKLTEEALQLQTSSDTILDWMSEKILGYIEESGLESSKSAFIDGPLIMDWEIEYHITEKLDYINQHKFQGEEERIEFLKLSMEQVRDSNQGTGSWGDVLLNKKKKNVTAKKQHSTAPAFENVERTSKISEVHDLFPDLGDGFIEACLKANDDNVEIVIMQLLEDNLPPSIAGLDRSMERVPLMTAADTVAQLSHLESEAATQDALIEQEIQEESILKTRRNIYDDDEFDIFAHRKVDNTKVYVGKKDKGNADKLLDDKSFIQSEKKNVLQRVVDMYDDDYDDTYDDINDAGLPADNGGDGDAALDIVKKKQQVVDPGVENESILVHTFVENPDIFVRNGTARKSTKRAELRKRTAMTDEQLEGWAIMFNRNVSYLVLYFQETVC
jgi:hypothetical protein